jgi:hypothetical protein
MRTLGEPAGSRRLTDEQNTVDEPEQTAPPSTRRRQPPAPPSPSDEVGEDGAADERTSPFPYAEKFDEWVADETATPDARQRRGGAGDADE